MAARQPIVVGVVCEAEPDRDTACGLAVRALARADGLTSSDAPLPAFVSCGISPAHAFLLWSQVRIEARQRHITAFGHFGGEPGAPDASAARLAIRIMLSRDPPPAAVMLIRDTDGDLRRRVGLEQARNHSSMPDRVILGVAHVKRECWVLAGFDAMNPAEHELLAQVRKQLGFNPCEQSHRLDAQGDEDKKSAKRVLSVLCCDDRARERQCWERAPLDTLIQCGRENGLADFIADVRSKFGPLVDGV